MRQWNPKFEVEAWFQGKTNSLVIDRIALSTNYNGLYLLSSSGEDQLKVHIGTYNESGEDYYYIDYANVTAEALGLKGLDLSEMETAQEAIDQTPRFLLRRISYRKCWRRSLQDYNRLKNVTPLGIDIHGIHRLFFLGFNSQIIFGEIHLLLRFYPIFDIFRCGGVNLIFCRDIGTRDRFLIPN